MKLPFLLYSGDARDVIKMMPADSVDAVVTDPPYELGFMGRDWDRSGVANDIAVWAECLRVLKPGGHLLAFSGSRTYHRMACAIEDAGFELRDQIMWLYGSGFPKSKNLDGDWEGWGTALKPAHEPICVARKPLAGTVAANVLEHGTGALNIDACRVHADDALGGQYTVKRFAPGASVNADGNWKQDVDYRGEMKAGRWPANVIHDGSDEVLAAFPDAPGQIARASSSSSRKTQNVYGALARGSDGAMPRDEVNESAARFFYCAKASRADRNDGVGGSDTPVVAKGATMRDQEDADWPARNGNYHPTVKPTELMAYLCRLVTPSGGLVLDPFMGSGSTGKAALREGFSFVGIDVTPEYVEIARARLAYEWERIERVRHDGTDQLSLELEA
ncbi:DNA-methyltransferase [Burkholderia stagnalis]|uniref:DNA-methyltransferase n=1 Tax=Burkholderia stagnalis TaxID=1503054 RepID=UPI000756A77F|nr:site-specific DNA-methyltransferase [Burkholderia stagnalis]KVX62833.1 DNA methyltransferase [Burkholderia stagnalis]